MKKEIVEIITTKTLQNITKKHYHSKTVFSRMLQNCIAILPAILSNWVN